MDNVRSSILIGFSYACKVLIIYLVGNGGGHPIRQCRL